MIPEGSPVLYAIRLAGLSNHVETLQSVADALRGVDAPVGLTSGGGGIRTRGPLARTLVFKTSAFDRSATPPGPGDRRS